MASGLNTVIVAGSDADAGDWVMAAALAIPELAAEPVTRVDWSDAVSPCAIVLVEAGGVDADTLADALPAIDGIAADIIIAFDEDQIDLVSAMLTNPRATFLCVPTPADRAAMLALVARLGMRDRHEGLVREGEAERLAHMTAEVARIADLLAQLTRPGEQGQLVDPAAVADRRAGFGAEPGSTPAIDPAEIRHVLRARRMRDRFFGTALFEEPAWDMILDLFAAHLERGRVSVSSLCIAAAVAPTTALRWIGRLVGMGLFDRHPDPLDRRRAYIALSQKGVEGMQAYVAATRAAGLPIA